MNMLGNGLRGYEKGSYGGWGGRVLGNENDSDIFPSSSRLNAAEMAADIVKQNNQPNQGDIEYPNFFPQAQRDFANRLKWSISENYSDANHEPEARVLGPLNLLAFPGQKIRLHGFVSDPDGDKISVKWWQFHGPIDFISRSNYVFLLFRGWTFSPGNNKKRLGKLIRNL